MSTKGKNNSMKGQNIRSAWQLALSLGLLSVVMFLPELIHAQPPPKPGNQIPIDGGIGWLFLAGIFYSSKKWIEKYKK